MPQVPFVQTHWRRSAGFAPRRIGIATAIHAVRIWLSRRLAYEDLNALDDRLLDDVGIPRDVARRLAKPPWWP